MLDLSIDDAHSRLTLPPSNPLFNLLKADVKTSITVVAHLTTCIFDSGTCNLFPSAHEMR